MTRVLIVILSSLLTWPAVVQASTGDRVWDFTVLLDGSRIGYHRFELSNSGDKHRLVSEASFDVRILFINAYKYRHSNTEVWNGECLKEFSAKTEVNSKRLKVSGEQSDDGFIVDDGESTLAIDDCVMTFAYWNSDFLNQDKLLNPQSGEYLDVEVDEMPQEEIAVRGEFRQAKVFRVSARGMSLKVWYSDSDEWLALESTAKGGRIIRYELT